MTAGSERFATVMYNHTKKLTGSSRPAADIRLLASFATKRGRAGRHTAPDLVARNAPSAAVEVICPLHAPVILRHLAAAAAEALVGGGRGNVIECHRQQITHVG